MQARERYRKADEDYRDLTAQARDLGPRRPDGAMALNLATRNRKGALQAYQTAVGRLTRLFKEAR